MPPGRSSTGGRPEVHDGRLDAHIRRAAIENHVHRVAEFGADVIGARRAEAAKAIRGGRDDAITERFQSSCAIGWLGTRSPTVS